MVGFVIAVPKPYEIIDKVGIAVDERVNILHDTQHSVELCFGFLAYHYRGELAHNHI